MKPINKLYLKTFLFLGISYALTMSAIDLFVGIDFNLWKFLFSIFFFGFFMSALLVTQHKNRLHEIGIHEITEDNIRTNQKRTIKSQLNINEILAKLKADFHIGRMKMRVTGNEILLKTSYSMFSFGENIKILQNVSANTDQEFEYLISSSPKFKGTLVDYGINIENINKVELAIKNDA